MLLMQWKGIFLSFLCIAVTITTSYQPNFLFHSCLRRKQKNDNASLQSEPIVILHGLLGSSRNFQNWVRLLHAELHGMHDIICIDLPNHGRSTKLGKYPMSYESMAMDVHHTINRLGIKSAHLIGHSMGGKAAALTSLYSKDQDTFRSLTIMDISPLHYSKEEFEDVSNSVHKLRQIDSHFTSSEYENKEEAQQLLNQLVEQNFEDKSLQLFVLSNAQLQQHGNIWKLIWSFHLNEIFDGLNTVAAFPITSQQNEIIAEYEFHNPMLLLKGSDSNFIRSSHVSTIAQMFPLYNLATVRKAGHWLHFDQPEETAQRVAQFLTSVKNYHQEKRSNVKESTDSY